LFLLKKDFPHFFRTLCREKGTTFCNFVHKKFQQKKFFSKTKKYSKKNGKNLFLIFFLETSSISILPRPIQVERFGFESFGLGEIIKQDEFSTQFKGEFQGQFVRFVKIKNVILEEEDFEGKCVNRICQL